MLYPGRHVSDEPADGSVSVCVRPVTGAMLCFGQSFKFNRAQAQQPARNGVTLDVGSPVEGRGMPTLCPGRAYCTRPGAQPRPLRAPPGPPCPPGALCPHVSEAPQDEDLPALDQVEHGADALLHEGVPVAPSPARGRKYVLRSDICYTMPYRGSKQSKQ